MSKNRIYITVNHLDDHEATYHLRPGDVLDLKKDHDNCCDDEAIVAYGKHQVKCGYVANSVDTVCRGTYSAGRLYDKVPEEAKCVVRFIGEDHLIAELCEGQE